MNSQKQKEKNILKKRKKRQDRKNKRAMRRRVSADEFLEIVRKDMQKWRWDERAFVIPNDMSPSVINRIRVIQAQYLTQRKLSAPSSRMSLYEFDDPNSILQIQGLVSDIEVNKNKPMYSKLLIEYPTVCGVFDSRTQKTKRLSNKKPFDSHVWISLNDFLGETSYGSSKISIGDNIQFTARVKAYHGRGDYAMKGYKYGLTDITVFHSGIYTYLPTDRRILNCRSNYPRGNDWVVSISTSGKLISFSVRPSIYPSYRERQQSENNGKN